MNVTETSHADWVWKPGSPAAPATRRAGSRCSSCPRTRAPAAAACPCASPPSRNQALWIEVYTAARPARRRLRRRRHRDRGRPGPPACPSSCSSSTSRCPTRTAWTRWSTTSPRSPSSTTAATSTPSTTASRTGTASSWSTPTTRRRCGPRPAASTGRDFTRREGLRGPGRGRGQPHRPARRSTARARVGTTRASAWSLADSWIDVPRERRARAPRRSSTCPTSPRPSEYDRIRTLAANVHSNPGPGKALPVFVTKHWVPRARRCDRHLVRGAAVVRRRRARPKERARGRSYWTYNGGRPNGPAIVIDAPATEARAMAWAAFKHDIDVYFFWHGVHWQHNRQKQGERRQNVWANPITFDNRGQPNKDRPRLHQRRRRPLLSGRGEGPSGGGPRHRRAGGLRAAREPAPRAAGPPVPDPGARARAHARRWTGPAGGRAARLLGGRRDGRLRGDGRRIRGGAPGPGRGDRGLGTAPRPGDRARAVTALAALLAAGRRRPAARAADARPSAPPDRGARPLLRPARAEGALRGGRAAVRRPARLGAQLPALRRRVVRAARARADARRPPAHAGRVEPVPRVHAAGRWPSTGCYGFPGFDAALEGPRGGRAGGRRRSACSRCNRWPTPARPRTTTTPCASSPSPSFALAAVEGHPSVEARAAPMRAQAARALDNILETTELVEPGGRLPRVDGLHADHLGAAGPDGGAAAHHHRRRSRAPLRRVPLMGPTYLYKVLPDGSTARDDDNEFPHLDAVDSVVLGYAVHRFKDPFAAWMLQKSGWLPERWRIPVLEFLWRDDTVAPRDPAPTTAAELPRERLFPGIGHVVLRDGWGPDSTWIEFSCGPYFAKHDHLDTNHFVDLPQGPPRPRQRRRLHGHGEPALPELLPAHRRPQHDARVPARRDLLLGREQVAGRQRRRTAHGLLALLELGAQPAGLAAHARPVGPRAHRGLRSRARPLHLRPRGRHRRLSPEQGRAVRARPGLAAARARPLRARPRAQRRSGLSQDLAPARRGRAEGRERRTRAQPVGQGGTLARRRAPGHVRGRAGPAARALRAARRPRRRRPRRARAGSSGRRATSAAGRGAAARTGRWTRRRAARCPPIPYLNKMWKTFWGDDLAQAVAAPTAARSCPAAGASRSRRRRPRATTCS